MKTSHQHRSTPCCIQLLLKLSIMTENGEKLLWAACHFVENLLKRHQISASLTFLNDIEAFLKDSIASKVLMEKYPGMYVQFLITKSLVMLRNDEVGGFWCFWDRFLFL